MSESSSILADLFSRRAIQLREDPFLRSVPEAPDLMGPSLWNRVEGMMLGLAIGDALGGPSEGLLPAKRRTRFGVPAGGDIRDYHSARGGEEGRRAKDARGYPSDDTQMAFWTLDQINQDRTFEPAHVAARFCRHEIFGIGQTVASFRRNMKQGKHWSESGPSSAGNGALMRIAPMLIPHLRTPSPGLWSDTALSAMLTHNDTGSIAACVAYIDILWRLLSMSEAPPARWYLERYGEIASRLETGTGYAPRGGAYGGYRGPMWKFVVERVGHALDSEQQTVEACNSWYSGAYLLETLPCVFLILCRYGHDPEEAIVRAVNDTKDNDTAAAIVGAAVGALYGRAGLPERWIENLTGRTGRKDDRKVFEILHRAHDLWAP